MRGNLAVIPFDGEMVEDTDGEDGSDNHTFEVTVNVVENGFVFSKTAEDDSYQKVFLFNGSGETGPKALVQEFIDSLGLSDKVKLTK